MITGGLEGGVLRHDIARRAIEQRVNEVVTGRCQFQSVSQFVLLGIVVNQAIRGSCGKHTKTTHTQQKGKVHK